MGDLVEGVRTRRDVVLTNGPFLRVHVGDAPVGGVARAVNRKVSVTVHVECAPWVDVTRLRILRASQGFDAAAYEAKIALRPNARGARVADLTRVIDVATDDVIVVVVTGERPLTPVLGVGGGDDVRAILPFAMSGATWVDADGDGRAFGLRGSTRAP